MSRKWKAKKHRFDCARLQSQKTYPTYPFPKPGDIFFDFITMPNYHSVQIWQNMVADDVIQILTKKLFVGQKLVENTVIEIGGGFSTMITKDNGFCFLSFLRDGKPVSWGALNISNADKASRTLRQMVLSAKAELVENNVSQEDANTLLDIEDDDDDMWNKLASEKGIWLAVALFPFSSLSSLLSLFKMTFWMPALADFEKCVAMTILRKEKNV